MKLFEVKVATCTQDGFFQGYKRIAFTFTEARGREVAKEAAAEIEALPTWWMCYHRSNGHPHIIVEEAGELVE